MAGWRVEGGRWTEVPAMSGSLEKKVVLQIF